MEFDSAAFRVEWYSGTGAGGQHRNKHQNSCRITHIASGTVVTAQCRSRENSLAEAKGSILAALNERSTRAAAGEMAGIRKAQVGSGERGDKIRTYRFQDNTVTDHRTGRRAQVSAVMAGRFDLLWL